MKDARTARMMWNRAMFAVEVEMYETTTRRLVRFSTRYAVCGKWMMWRFGPVNANRPNKVKWCGRGVGLAETQSSVVRKKLR